MSSGKLSARCTSVLVCCVIGILLAVIIVVWVQFSQGAFRSNKPRYNISYISNRQVSQVNNRFLTNKEYLEKSHLEDIGRSSDMEYVKPIKVSPLPLHDQDIIYDQINNNNEKPPLRHHSGHFRHTKAEVWDPHPQYEINAFGQKLQLELTHNDKFVSPNLHITHIFSNYSQKVKHDPKMSGCFYTGHVKGESGSSVAVSLCNGMTGYIHTLHSNYYIEPAEKSPEDITSSFMHRIKKIPHDRFDKNIFNPLTVEQCETSGDNRSPVVEDFSGDIIEDHIEISHQPLRTRRHILQFDDVHIKSKKTTSHDLHRPRRDADFVDYESIEKRNTEYFIKVLVVADKTMMEYHQSAEDLTRYILTLMSHVALLYKDATIGNAISLAVVKVHILKDREFANSNSQLMLRNFCEWQNKYGGHEIHDTALLLTRDSICKNTSTVVCNTLGVAEVGSMCKPSSSCAIIRDKGISSSYTIAHELGHVLNMPHDDDRKCDMFYKTSRENNIMSKMLQNDTKPWCWSACSKYFVTEFLDSSKARCLLSPPDQNYILSSQNSFKQLPGEMFEANTQCELEFGKGAKSCSYMPRCGSLWCATELGEREGCQTQHMPVAEGTTCGPRRWCHHGQCIALDRDLLTPIEGGWGPWQAWSECSRTCGGGIKMSKRACDSPVPENGGAYCIGISVRYVSCNSQPCKTNVPDFREMQCAQFNGITKNLPNLTSDVEWIPKYGLDPPENSCKLYCRPKNSEAYYRLKEKVIDGTKCGLNTYDICVNGICRNAGCDNVLESNATLDECGVCGGNNSRCEEIYGTYNISSYDYNRVARIPKGSFNLIIQQRRNPNYDVDKNYLVLRDGETGSYLLNGNHIVAQHAKDVIYSGVVISYSGSEAPLENITTPRHHKLTKDLIIEVLSVGVVRPPDITYRYVMSRDTAPRFDLYPRPKYLYRPRYSWRLYQKQWTECDSECSGVQYMKPDCIEIARDIQVEEKYCTQLEMESVMRQQNCNMHCRFTWNIVAKDECSSSCGKGKRKIHYKCMRVDNTEYPEGKTEVVDDKYCEQLPGQPSMETCHVPCGLSRWEYSEWTECSKSCGGGIQIRKAICIDIKGQQQHPSRCNDQKKLIQQSCNTGNCPVWMTRDWTPCSVSCGKGYRTKPYYCTADGRIMSQDACDSRDRPIYQEICMMGPCEHWTTGSWSQCSVSCGEGYQRREVNCTNIENGKTKDENYCRDMLRPNDTKICTRPDCKDIYVYRSRNEYENDFDDNSINVQPIPNQNYEWVTGTWSQCSQSCNNGTKKRMVVCRSIRDRTDVPDYLCYSLRPIDLIQCNMQPCPNWKIGDWSQCDQNCERRRQISCQSTSGELLDDSKCDITTRESYTERCKSHMCSGSKNRRRFDNSKGRYAWAIGRWRPCSKTCGQGVRRRTVQCEDSFNGKIMSDAYCNHMKKPRNQKSCERYNCSHAWIESSWSECSKSCGTGVKSRNITCHKVYSYGMVNPTPIPEFSSNGLQPKEFCDTSKKPNGQARCRMSNCGDVYVWRTSQWRQCSHECGRKGRQTRQLYCVDRRNNQHISKNYCPAQFKPLRKRKCNQLRCLHSSCKKVKDNMKTRQNRDYLLLIHNKPALVYCYKMDTPEPEEFISLHGDRPNYSEFYDKRLKNTNSCPNHGQRNDNCTDCLQVGPERSGATRFWKVRLNITTLQIIPDDFTFSKQLRGKKIPYGTSGDCYSSIWECIQGQFVIDLSETSFKLSNSIIWQNIGHQATQQIRFTYAGAHGKCGGYCGNCVPDPNIGLKVEIT